MMIQQKLYSHEEMLNKVLGEKGTPERNQYVLNNCESIQSDGNTC